MQNINNIPTSTATTNQIQNQQDHSYRIENLVSNEWQNVTINIGLFGESDPNDQSKLKFIYNLTGSYTLQPVIIDSLKVYRHQNNPNFLIWDLSWIQTEMESNIQDLFNHIDSNKYDFFIIYRNNEFTNSDYQLAFEIEKKKKKVYFVTIDLHKKISSDQKMIKIDHNLDDKEIIKSLSNQIKDILLKENIYVLSRDEFGKLNEDIIKNLADEKIKAYLLTIEPLSKDIIEKKAEILKSRTSHVSVSSSLFGSFFSLPGLAIIADITILTTEIWFYRKQLGLTQENFQKMSKNTKEIYQKFLQILSNSKYGSYVILNDVHSITGLLIKTLPLLVISDMTDLVKYIPLFGAALHGTVSIATTKYALIQIIDEFAKIASDIQNLVSNQKIIAESDTAGLTDKAADQNSTMIKA